MWFLTLGVPVTIVDTRAPPRSVGLLPSGYSRVCPPSKSTRFSARQPRSHNFQSRPNQRTRRTARKRPVFQDLEPHRYQLHICNTNQIIFPLKRDTATNSFHRHFQPGGWLSRCSPCTLTLVYGDLHVQLSQARPALR